ncbi:hypothetical protein [Streptomyces erythrochromogenes]|uniref:hypothetical protein n=1 Tax=Streptomyces erythrochromogenes TaxID=285574 RepID=UPI00386AB9DF|nr:hypothetical protein OG364_00875 [Streptomyces erythrochromogenes]WST98374.1 hypothetical protein OG364_40660 [Streptomyces erythrochromogenes]
MKASSVASVPRDFLCEHTLNKSRVLVLLAHRGGPASLQAVLTCRDAGLAQQAARLLTAAAANGALTTRESAAAQKVSEELPEAPASSFRQALERARSGEWPTSPHALSSWSANALSAGGSADGAPGTELSVSAVRSPKDARLADLPGSVVRVVQLREFHIYDEDRVLAAAAAGGWEPMPDQELGDDDPKDLVGAVMFAAETTGELPGLDWLTDAQEASLLLPSRGDEVADWSTEAIRVNFGTGWRLRQAQSPYSAPSARPDSPSPDFAALFPLPLACDCGEEDCGKCDWQLSPRSADLLYSALVWLAESAYDDAAELGERPLTEDDDGTWGVFSRLPEVAWSQGMQWRRGLARACDDLAGDLAGGSWPQPTCAAEEMVLHLALQDAPDHVGTADEDPAHAALPTHRDDYDFDACSDLFFQDHDVLWLLSSRYNQNTATSDSDQPLVPDALRPDNWFEGFLNVPARAADRGYRR